ncbi:hypothetical protein HZY62_04060 [Maribacter polysiphoniae]|uniref:Uncharacterized protein n=1 Tax=Maribacter polysiphoniae TaxID=429344 RepID=A0ABR7VW41_9FLAO|nr:hypothetical protein [Maribacter polysiphoniae]MBD1259750.1 hypothetical protein [Maribacter polysiphoniae]
MTINFIKESGIPKYPGFFEDVLATNFRLCRALSKSIIDFFKVKKSDRYSKTSSFSTDFGIPTTQNPRIHFFKELDYSFKDKVHSKGLQ